AENATIIANNGGIIIFQTAADAGTAHITINSGGHLVFADNATGSTATVVTTGGAIVDFGTSNGTSIGSLSGAGAVYLGGTQVAVGTLGLNDVFSGVIGDSYSVEFSNYVHDLPGGTLPPAIGGILEKTGTGTLTLTG